MLGRFERNPAQRAVYEPAELHLAKVLRQGISMLISDIMPVLLFAASIPIWLIIYRKYLAGLFADIYVERIESGQIDLNYLLDEGGVFDALVDRFMEALKHGLLAQQGQLTRAATTGELGADPAALGIEGAGELLKMVGIKKPPAMLQFKVAQALGQMFANQKGGEVAQTFEANFEAPGDDPFAP